MMENHEFIVAEAVGLLKSLIRIPSLSREENCPLEIFSRAEGFLSININSCRNI
jgi:hypothetical protein